MPISDCDVRDPRIRRTRQLLQGALTDLMAQKSFEAISVQDITEAATVNRATFYDHYTDKFALLEATVAGGFHRLLAERAVRYEGACPKAASAVIEAACDFLTQKHSQGETCRYQNPFQPLMDAAITKAIRRVLAEGMARHMMLPPAQREMRAAAASAAIYGAVRQWSDTPERPPAEEIVPEILRLVTPLLAEETKEQGGGASDTGAPNAATLQQLR